MAIRMQSCSERDLGEGWAPSGTNPRSPEKTKTLPIFLLILDLQDGLAIHLTV
jgi:hypothetical protein